MTNTPIDRELTAEQEARATALDDGYIGSYRMAREIVYLRDEAAEHKHTFDLRWKADQRAIQRWQEAHPGNDLTWPDHADMVVWLLEEDAKLRSEVARLKAREDDAADQIRQYNEIIGKLRARVNDAQYALQRIERWEGEFPATGRVWDDGTNMSYFACFGSNGERDFMREIAREMLVKLESL
jgi:hypothetical protein